MIIIHPFFLQTHKLVDSRTSPGEKICKINCGAYSTVANGGQSCQRNRCKCQFGRATDQCLKDGAVSCQYCWSGFLKKRTYSPLLARSVYTCVRRTPDNFSCPKGFHLSEDGRSCQANQCWCRGGSPKQNCHKHNTEQCAYCTGGYSSHSKWSEKIVKITPDGESIKICELKCSEGYYLQSDGQACIKNVCQCRGGESSRNCYENGAQSCSKCHHGFVEVYDDYYNMTCEKKSNVVNIVSDDDDEEISIDVPVQIIDNLDENGEVLDYGDSFAQELNELQQIAQEEQQQQQQNNSDFSTEQTQIDPTQTDNESNEQDLICQAGFHKEEGRNLIESPCVPNICTCNGGTPKSGKNCPTHNTENCDECQRKFQEVIDPNDTNIMTCEIECPQGSRLNFNKNGCQQNMCTCKDGQGKNKCHKDGDESCKKCNGGFNMTLDQENSDFYGVNIFRCQKLVCTCKNGVAGEDCTAKKPEKCASCDEGYLLSKDTCVPAMLAPENGR